MQVRRASHCPMQQPRGVRRAAAAACYVQRMYAGFKRRPQAAAEIVFCNMVVEACLGLPLLLMRLFEMILCDLTRAKQPGMLILFRMFIILCGMAMVALSSSVYVELRMLRGDAGDPWLLAEDRRVELRRGGKLVLTTRGCLVLLQLCDVRMALSEGLSQGPLGRFVAWCFYFLIILNVLLTLVSFIVYRWHWQRGGDPVATAAVHRVWSSMATEERSRVVAANLDERSRKLEEGLEEMCCICLDCPERADVVSTLPCGHSFHRACLERWLLEPSVRHCRSCPFRCAASPITQVVFPAPHEYRPDELLADRVTNILI